MFLAGRGPAGVRQSAAIDSGAKLKTKDCEYEYSCQVWVSWRRVAEPIQHDGLASGYPLHVHKGVIIVTGGCTTTVSPFWTVHGT